MPEYLEHRCCLCPQRGSSSQVCPGIPGSLHPEPSPCRFVKSYEDRLYTTYSIKPDNGKFRTFYRQAGAKRGCKVKNLPDFPIRDDFDAAQVSLNKEAKRRGWTEVTR